MRPLHILWPFWSFFPRIIERRGKQSGLLTFRRYHEGEMEEQRTVGLRLTLEDDAAGEEGGHLADLFHVF